MNLQFGWKAKVVNSCPVTLTPVGKMAKTEECIVLLIDSIMFRVTLLLCRLNDVETAIKSNSGP